MLLKLEALRIYLYDRVDILGVTRDEILGVMDINSVDYRENYELINKVCVLTDKEVNE